MAPRSQRLPSLNALRVFWAAARHGSFVKAAGKLKRSEFGMVKYIDMVGDTVDFSIRTDAWR